MTPEVPGFGRGLRTQTMKLLARALSAVVALLASALAHAAAPLPVLNVDKTQITVSGLSSGGFMATQLGHAHSSTFKGVGVFAGGPYMCGGHSAYTACLGNASISASRLATMRADLDRWSGAAIDDTAQVAAQKVYLFVGAADEVVGPNPMSALRTQYLDLGVPGAKLHFMQRPGVAHVFPTDFDAPGLNACASSTSPFISNCGYDGARAVLSHFYGTLNPRNDAPAAARFIEFDQTAFTTNPGMAATGWAYVPQDCAEGAPCRLHVALHGCLQASGNIGDKFVKHTGYARWADTNRIVLLFPQARVDNTLRATAASGLLPNGNGCWDWIGWYGANFAQKSGAQVTAIKAMVDRIAAIPATPFPASCTTASNYAHTAAGRAYARWFITYARGSNQNMGWWNIFATTTLKQTGPDHYVVGTCP